MTARKKHQRPDQESNQTYLQARRQRNKNHPMRKKKRKLQPRTPDHTMPQLVEMKIRRNFSLET